MVERAGLIGRGGAGFPTATKLRAVARGRGRPVVVVNGAEGEPASRKDALLLSTRRTSCSTAPRSPPRAVGADEIDPRRRPRPATATASASQRASATAAARPRPFAARPRAGRYVAGEETALVAWLDGGAAKPTVVAAAAVRARRRRSPDAGAERRDPRAPRAHRAYGADWFRDVGHRRGAGTALVTVSRRGRAPGVYEVGLGMPLATLLARRGGRMRADQRVSRRRLLRHLDRRPAYASAAGCSNAAWPRTAPRSARHDRAPSARRLRRRRDRARRGLSRGRERRAVRAVRARARMRSRADSGRWCARRSRRGPRLERRSGRSRPGACRHPDGAVALVGAHSRCSPPSRPAMRQAAASGPHALLPSMKATTKRLRLNPIACDGHGLCADLLPELSARRLGVPDLDGTPVPRAAARARAARSRMCPSWRCSYCARAERASGGRVSGAPLNHCPGGRAGFESHPRHLSKPRLRP